MILPTMLDGVETWVITSGMMIEFTTAYNKMVRSSLRYTTNTQRKCAITSEKTYELLQVKPLQHYIDILCCQETSLPTTSDERWDSEEIMLGGGIEETRGI
jgi:hypothetical protein